MLITIKKEVEELIEVGEFPLYTKSLPFYYKIISEDQSVRVTISEFESCECVERLSHKSIIKDQLAKGERITENEFIDAYVKAVHAVHQSVYPEGLAIELPLRKTA